MSTFELMAAIDLRGGRVVRLRQGDFDRETVYGEHPVDVVRAFAAAGATWLHVVDLEGARAGEPRQLDVVAGIVAESQGRLRVEVSGGLRTPGSVAGALAAGASRVAVGTAALRDPAFAAETVGRHGADRIAASIDVRDGRALGDGWRSGATGIAAVEAVRRLADAGVQTFEVTAIERDGLLEGPDLRLLGDVAALRLGRIIASGGVAGIEDLLAVRDVGCAGAIVGRALYEGRLDLAAAIRALGGGERAGA